jgi:hypothetical protein
MNRIAKDALGHESRNNCYKLTELFSREKRKMDKQVSKFSQKIL